MTEKSGVNEFTLTTTFVFPPEVALVLPALLLSSSSPPQLARIMAAIVKTAIRPTRVKDRFIEPPLSNDSSSERKREVVDEVCTSPEIRERTVNEFSRK